MQASGSGLTFTDHDVAMCRVVIGLLSMAKFQMMDAKMIREASPAFAWIEALLPQIKDHIFDLSEAKLIQPPPKDPEPKDKRKAK